MAVLQVKGVEGEEHTCKGGEREMCLCGTPLFQSQSPERAPVPIPCFPVAAAQPRRKSTLKIMDVFMLERK